MRVIRQTIDRVFEVVGESFGGGGVPVGDVTDDLARLRPRLCAPNDAAHQAGLVRLAAMMARSSAIT